MSFQLPRSFNAVRQTAAAARARNLVYRQTQRALSVSQFVSQPAHIRRPPGEDELIFDGLIQESTTEAPATRLRIRRLPSHSRADEVIEPEKAWTRPMTRRIKLGPERGVISQGKDGNLRPTKSFFKFSKPITVEVPNAGTASWSPIWLRENCQCPKCVHPDTRQRLISIESIPLEITDKRHSVDPETGLEVEWEDGHVSNYSWKWLRTHMKTPVNTTQIVRSDMKFVPNDPKEFPTVAYDEVMASDDGVREWTRKIHVYGFCFVKGCPVDPGATEKLLERIAFIRRTHYGDFWDFTSNLALKDMAYTTEGLGVHTDTAYFTDPAGLQMFHLLSHTGGEGGESVLVDGFEAARILHSEDADAYRTLQKPVFGHHASGNQDVCIKPLERYPTFAHASSTGELYQVRWNNEDRAASNRATPDLLAFWYRAAQKWAEILKRPSVVRQFRLEPGTPLIFDNWRMLHGRTAFTGARRMCGGYINHDDFRSRYELLNKGREQMLLEL